MRLSILLERKDWPWRVVNEEFVRGVFTRKVEEGEGEEEEEDGEEEEEGEERGDEEDEEGEEGDEGEDEEDEEGEDEKGIPCTKNAHPKT
ncbi:hypothetical protein TWF788_008797 [Orbilia oligospora]|uniref:Uncharacterized protein n=1 Tax=Orbilia oligospora TaxID=2813651 RepID=A0A7C8PR36_ORBOL|nr:hypothetical protein TWF788_008797 [Orbilia oligospora]